MISAADHIEAARFLMSGSPSETRVRRAVSTAYYAVFHHLCLAFSALVLRPAPGSFSRAWLQTYRYPDHGPLKQKCGEVATNSKLGFPDELRAFARAFTRLQDARIVSDYNPVAMILAPEAADLIITAERAIVDFERAPTEQQRAFVLFLCLRPKTR